MGVFIANHEVGAFYALAEEAKNKLLDFSADVNNNNRPDRDEFLINIIKNLIQEKELDAANITSLKSEELARRLYWETDKYSFLTHYLSDPEVEDISVNSYDNIQITYADGVKVLSEELFNGPMHAFDIIGKLLRPSGMVLDDTHPVMRGFLSEKVRVTAYGPPVIDESAGVTASIRMVNPKNLNRGDLIANGTCNAEMFDFLSEAFSNGISMISAGSIGSGKTTMTNSLLESLPPYVRLLTIEMQTRELRTLKRDEQGRAISDVVHLVTKDYLNHPERNVDQDLLLEHALTSAPQVICIGECKSSEAYTGLEAANLGHAVATTLHAISAKNAYRRMAWLAKKKYNDDMAYMQSLAEEGFPIVFYLGKDAETNQRRITEILECVSSETDPEKRYRTLYAYQDGEFKKLNPISVDLKKRLLNNGMSERRLKEIA
jgi:pilus assembly protein CpaF